jgi:hypothetical protein
MTIQTPYQPAPAQPAAVYPTAPPWAPAPPPVEQPGPGGAGLPYPAHGQLMVPYPQAMRDAARPEPPSWWPVLVVTVLFGVFGAIPAARRAARAKRDRNSRAPYWVVFGISLVAVATLEAGVAVVGVPAWSAARETAATTSLQSGMVDNGKINTPAGTTVRSAACTPVGRRGPSGLRAYTCVVTLSDGQTGTMKVVADRHGVWKTRK